MNNSLDKVIYEHEMLGERLTFEISEHIEIEKLSHLNLNTVWLGSWDTPQEERVKGFQLRAITEGSPESGQQIHNFYRDSFSDEDILSISSGLARFLGVELYCDHKAA